MPVKTASNSIEPSRRILRIHPKIFNFCRRARLGFKGKSVVLPVELDMKVSQDRVYVPEYLSKYLSEIDSLVPFSDEPDSLVSLSLVAVADHDDFEVPNATYMAKLLEGLVLTCGEPLAVCVGGVHRLYEVHSDPVCGVVSQKTRLSVGEPTPTEEKRGFGRVGGLYEVVELLLSTVKRPLIQRELYERYGLTPPRGILLFGPPGTGKTLLVKALSEELEGTLVVSSSGTELSGPDSSEKIHSLFEDARKNCSESGFGSILIFIDEIDALCPARDGSVGESERRSVAALLTEMDGFEKGKSKNNQKVAPLVVIGATNRPNSIDMALRRPGRFEREIEIPPPSFADRESILGVIAREKYFKIWNPTPEELRAIASKTHGFVGADLSSLIAHAAFHALETGMKNLDEKTIIDQLVRVRPSALRELAVSVPKTHWEDIGGYQEVKAQLIEAVIWPLSYSEHFTRMNVDPPRGVLLYGPPGCSKTMMARAVATESSMNFIAVKGPEVFSKWVGESEQAVRDLFRKARQASPCVIFFDEIDAIAAQRESGDGGVGNRVLTQLLTEMDGVSGSKKIVVIAATNRPHVLDPALIRPGRLDRLVYVGLPDKEARVRILSRGIGKIPHDSSCESDGAVELLAAKTEGFSGAEIVMMLKEAAISCIKSNVGASDDICDTLDALSLENQKNQLLLTWKHLEEALAKIKPRTLPSSLDVFDSFRNSAK